jgi:hypothetical protein
MSEIPYVNQLGDALDVAIARRARAPRLPRLGRRRYLAVALAALAVGGGGAAVAGLFTDPVEIGFGSVGCFDRPGTGGDVAIVSDPTRSPVDVCAAALQNDGLEAGDLIACQWEGHGIVVMPHEGRANCAALDLSPVPPAYDRAQLRAAALQAVAIDFERGAGCLTPPEFAKRLTARLQAGGWASWRAVVGGGRGPCGRVSVPNGFTGLGSIGSIVDAKRRTITIKGRAPIELERVIYGPGSPGVSLFDSSGERCFTVSGLEQHAREVLARVQVPIRFAVHRMPPNQGTEPPRGDRYAEGCAIYVGAYPDFPGGRTEVVAELRQRDAPVEP